METNLRARTARRRGERGAALLTAIIFTALFALLIGGALAYVQTHVTNAWYKSSTESALLLAEGGVNDELSYIRRNRTAYPATNRCSSPGPTTLNGQPYKGRRVDVANVGTYWVFTHTDIDGTGAWSGTGPFYITCNSLVGGVHRKVRIQSQIGGGGNPLELYAIFGVNSSTNGSTKAVTFSNGDCVVDGNVGTNGEVGANSQTENNKVTFTAAHNCNTAVMTPGSQFVNDQYNPAGTVPIYSQPSRKIFPTVSFMLREFLAKAPYNYSAGSNDAAWTYLSGYANNDNPKIRRFKAGATTLDYANTEPLPGIVAPGNNKPIQSFLGNGNMTKTGNSNPDLLGNGGSEGTFTEALAYNGAKITLGPIVNGVDAPIDDINPGDKVLIFPPGIYYFTKVQVDYIAGHKIVIDDDWKTANPSSTDPKEVVGNPQQKQVIFMFASGDNASDFIRVPVTFTSPGGGDASIFRMLYNKEGKEFEFTRKSGTPAGDLNVYGAVYSVIIEGAGNVQPTVIRFVGESATGGYRVALIGGLIADKVTIQGYGYIRGTKDIYNPNDILKDLDDWGGYDDSSG